MSAFNNILELDQLKSDGKAKQTPLEIVKDLVSGLNQQLEQNKIYLNMARFKYESSPIIDRVRHSLTLKIEKLKYVIEILAVEHEILKLYPVKLIPNMNIVEYNPFEESQAVTLDVAPDKEGLIKILSNYFKLEKVKNAISTLLAQA